MQAIEASQDQVQTQKKRTWTSKKVIRTLDPNPAARVGTQQMPGDVQGNGKEISHSKVQIREDLRKHELLVQRKDLTCFDEV